MRAARQDQPRRRRLNAGPNGRCLSPTSLKRTTAAGTSPIFLLFIYSMFLFLFLVRFFFAWHTIPLNLFCAQPHAEGGIRDLLKAICSRYSICMSKRLQWDDFFWVLSPSVAWIKLKKRHNHSHGFSWARVNSMGGGPASQHLFCPSHKSQSQGQGLFVKMVRKVGFDVLGVFHQNLAEEFQCRALSPHTPPLFPGTTSFVGGTEFAKFLCLAKHLRVIFWLSWPLALEKIQKKMCKIWEK